MVEAHNNIVERNMVDNNDGGNDCVVDSNMVVDSNVVDNMV